MEERNYYKLKKRVNPMVKGEKRGQLAVFVIIAVVIVGLIILAVILFPNIRNVVTNTQVTPQSYLSSCITPYLKNAETLLNAQGGYANPEGYYAYDENGKNTTVKFLCYTSAYYKTCVVQDPDVTTSYEQQLGITLEQNATSCFNQLENYYIGKGYTVNGNLNNITVSVNPNNIGLTFYAPLTLTKGSVESFGKVDVEAPSDMFDILSVVQSIVGFESVYGDSQVTTYLEYYPNLRVEKTKMSDGTKIYKVSNVITKEEFIFASRSLSWPPGYNSTQ